MKVGMLVTGKENSREQYNVTNQNSLCLVKNIRGNYMVVTAVAAGIPLDRFADCLDFQVLKSLFEPCTYEQYIQKMPNAHWAPGVDLDMIRSITNEETNVEVDTEVPAESPADTVYLTKEQWGANVLSTEKHEELRGSCIRLLKEYGYNPTDQGLDKILSKWNTNKGWIVNLFANHPKYNGNYQIVLNEEFERIPNISIATDFCYWLRDRCHFIKKEKQIGAFSYTEVLETVRRLISIHDSACQITQYDYHVTINGMSVEELVREKERWYAMYDRYRNTSDIYVDDDRAWDKQSYEDVSKVKKAINIIRDNMNTIVTEHIADKVNYYYPEAKAAAGQKVSRLMRKICDMSGLSAALKDQGFEKQFAKFSDAVNPKKEVRQVVLSVHPIDFFTMSFGNSWSSCHTIDKQNMRNMPNGYSGQYSSGTLSYMLDSSSFVFYTVDKNCTENFELQDKINRNMFHIGEDKVVQARVYPQTTDEADGMYKQIREVVLKTIDECLGAPSTWENVKGTNECEAVISSFGTHYQDYNHFYDCNVSYIKRHGMRNRDIIKVGQKPICPHCGNAHSYRDAVECDYCYVDRSGEVCCSECGDWHDRDYMHEIDGHWYCEDCCFYCEYHNRWEVGSSDDAIYIDNYGYICESAFENSGCFEECEHCGNVVFSERYGFRAEDGTFFCSERCAREDDYVYTEQGWYHIDEVTFCEHCEEYVLNEDWNPEHNCCNDCVSDLVEEAV